MQLTSNKNFILKYFRCRDGKITETRIGMEGICITHSCIPLYTVYIMWWNAGMGNTDTVPLTSNLTRSCKSLASRSRVQLSVLARRIGYTRENTGLHSREHLATLARTLGHTRENTWPHSREHLATLARTLGHTHENTSLHSRGPLGYTIARSEQLATLARPLGYTREATVLNTRGYTREATWLRTRGHLATHARPLGYSRGHCYRRGRHNYGGGAARHFLNPMCMLFLNTRLHRVMTRLCIETRQRVVRFRDAGGYTYKEILQRYLAYKHVLARPPTFPRETTRPSSRAD